MLTRPSQMTSVELFNPLLDWDDHKAALAEERASRWLERITWAAGGCCIGCLAIWLGLILA